MATNKIKNIAVLCVLRLFSWFPLSVGRLKGRCLGRLVFALNLKPARIARFNIDRCYSDLSSKERVKLCKLRMMHLGQSAFEMPKVWHKGNPWVTQKIISIEGLDLFKQSISDDRGTILIIPHQGNWEVVGLWASQMQAMTSLYDPPRLEALESWIKSAREQSGAVLVPTNIRGVAALAKALHRGEMTGILPDQHPPASGGRLAPLLGIETRTMTLIYKLLKKSGAQAIMASALRVSGGWTLHFTHVSNEIYSDDEATSLAALNKGVEDVIALAPDQYQWEYNRFREIPLGESIHD